MNNFDATYGHLLLGFADGSLNDADHAEAARLAGNDVGFAAGVAELREVHDALDLLAHEANAGVPVVDLFPRVLSLVEDMDPADSPMASALMGLGDAWRAGVPTAVLFDGAPGEVFDAEVLTMEAVLFDTGTSTGAAGSVDFTASLAAMLPMDDEESIEPGLEAALFAVGGALNAEAPMVDLWSGVLGMLEAEEVVSAEATTRNIVPFPGEASSAQKRREAVSPMRLLRLGMLAAAATILFIAGYAVRDNLPTSAPVQTAAQPNENPNVGDELTLAAVHPEGDGEGGISLRPSPAGGTPPGPRANPSRKARPLTLKEVVGTFQSAMREDATALGQMAAWASLTREEARALLEVSGVSADAVIGAAQFLPVEEALAVLQAAVDNNPEDPYLRYALANRFQETSDTAGYQRALDEWRTADPQNAMPYYLSAQMMLAQGDTAGATGLVNMGASLSGASVYGSNSARSHAAALQASGYDRNTARLLAAASAGSTDGASLHSLSDDLMARAQELESQGQYEAAADLYDAVRVFGEQVMASADLPNTQIIAYEIQQDAVSAMMALQDVWTPETLDALTQMADAVLNGIGQLTGALTDLTGLLMSDDVQQVLDYTDAILSGDLGRLFGL